MRSIARPPLAVQDIALDSAGNVYVTGSTNVKGYNGVLTMKYTPTGKRKWFRIYGAALYASGGASAMDIDDAGSVYVTGGIQSETASYEYATLKYDTNGKQQWVIRYTGPKDFDISETIAPAHPTRGHPAIGARIVSRQIVPSCSPSRVPFQGDRVGTCHPQGCGKVPETADSAD